MTSRFFWILIVVLAAPLFAAPYDPYNTVVVGLADANCEITSVVDPVRVTEWYPFWNDDGSIQSVAAYPHGRVLLYWKVLESRSSSFSPISRRSRFLRD